MKYTVLAVLMLAAFNASATNNNPPKGGDNEFNVHSGSSSNAAGVGIGGDSSASVGAIKNTANGGAGGSALSVSEGGKGGDAKAYGGNQGQSQGQGQHQSSKSIAQQALENSNKINASSANDNRSSASGNSTNVNVGGDSTLVERNAPPVFLGAITPTSCGGSIQAGGSSRDGAGAFGVSWVGTECSLRMIGDRFQQLGMVDSACEVYRSTKAFQKAAKRNPKLASLDCTAKPAPAAVTAPVVFPLTDRKPRG